MQYAVFDQPHDDSALREMIAGVYEECAKVCDRFGGREAANKLAEKREQKQKIMAIIEQKKDAALSEASLADLEKMLAGM